MQIVRRLVLAKKRETLATKNVTLGVSLKSQKLPKYFLLHSILVLEIFFWGTLGACKFPTKGFFQTFPRLAGSKGSTFIKKGEPIWHAGIFLHPVCIKVLIT